MNGKNEANDLLTDALECLVALDTAVREMKDALRDADIKSRKTFEHVRRAKRLLDPPKK